MTDHEADYDITDATSDYLQYSRHDANRVITAWPVREQYDDEPIRTTRSDVLTIVVGVIVMGGLYLGLALWGAILLAGAAR